MNSLYKGDMKIKHPSQDLVIVKNEFGGWIKYICSCSEVLDDYDKWVDHYYNICTKSTNQITKVMKGDYENV